MFTKKTGRLANQSHMCGRKETWAGDGRSFEGPQVGAEPRPHQNPVGPACVHEPHPCLEPRREASCVDIQSVLSLQSPSGFSTYSSWHTRRPLSTRPACSSCWTRRRCGPRAAGQVPGRVGGHSSPTSGPDGPMVAAGPGPAAMAEASLSGDSVPRAERHLGGPQPGRVPCSLSQAQRGHGSLEGGQHKAP